MDLGGGDAVGGDEVAVDGHRDGVAQLGIVPRRLGRLDGVVVGAEIGSDAQLVAELRLQVGELLGRDVVVAVELAGLEALDSGRAVLGREVVDDVDLHIVGVIEFRVLDQLDVVVGHEFGERVGAVRDEVAGLDPVGPGQWQGEEYLLQIPYGKSEELIMEIMRYLPDVEVLEPVELRSQVKQRIEQAHKIFSN